MAPVLLLFSKRDTEMSHGTYLNQKGTGKGTLGS